MQMISPTMRSSSGRSSSQIRTHAGTTGTEVTRAPRPRDIVDDQRRGSDPAPHPDRCRAATTLLPTNPINSAMSNSTCHGV
jgi:hypothetical protein